MAGHGAGVDEDFVGLGFFVAVAHGKRGRDALDIDRIDRLARQAAGCHGPVTVTRIRMAVLWHMKKRRPRNAGSLPMASIASAVGPEPMKWNADIGHETNRARPIGRRCIVYP